MMDLSMLEEGNSKNKLFDILQNITFQENLFMRMQVLYTIINTLDQEIAMAVNANSFKKWLKEIKSNTDLVRKIRLLSKINESTEMAIDYYSEDYISHPDLNYDIELNKTIEEINDKISDFIGRLMKELLKQDEIEI